MWPGVSQQWAIGRIGMGCVGAWRRPGHVNVPDPPQWTHVHALGAHAAVRTVNSAHCVSLTCAHMAAAHTMSTSACPGIRYSCAPPRGSSVPDLAQIIWRQIAVPDTDGQRELVCVRGRQYHLADDVAWLTSEDTMQRPPSWKPFAISPAAISKPGAQCRTALSDPGPPCGSGG